MKVNPKIGGLLTALFTSSGLAIGLSSIEKATLYFVTPDYLLVATSAPDRKTDRDGQFWIDKANNSVYKSTGNNGVDDWKTV